MQSVKSDFISIFQMRKYMGRKWFKMVQEPESMKNQREEIGTIHLK